MTDASKGETESLESIIWNDWGIVEVLSDRRAKLKEEIIEALYNVIKDEEEAPETATSSSITGNVQKRTAGRGVETKYFKTLGSENELSDGTVNDQISLGAITIDFPKGRDGRVSLEVSASLPQARISGNSLEESKKYIEQRVKAESKHLIGNSTRTDEQSDQQVLNIADLDAATGRNDIAKRIVVADEFNDPTGDGAVNYYIEEFLDSVMGIYKLYKRIPRWLADIPSRET